MDVGAPEDVFQQLVACQTPLLCGVRHHSAALARVLPSLLDDFAPEAVLVEMPTDFRSWIKYLGRDDLETPVALAACDQAKLLSFYPLADFSPELVAIRWAARHGVPVEPIDASLSQKAAWDEEELVVEANAPSSHEGESLLHKLLERNESRDSGDLWERLVETPANDSTPEAIRRAALWFGWTLRYSAGGATLRDAAREAAMRQAIAAAPKHSVAVIGAFHAAALLPDPIRFPAEPRPESLETNSAPTLTTCLVPYSFSQLDQRSGYPAGVLDPEWQQAMLAAGDPAATHATLTEFAVALCRRLREAGHTAGTPDAVEIVRFAGDLARLRKLAAPGRGELLEAIQSCLVCGDLWGRGRAVAAAARQIFIGQRRGRVPAGIPRGGLTVQVEETVARLKLPGPEAMDSESRELRLDPLRSRLDRARAVTFRRSQWLGVQYAQRIDVGSVGDRENLTEVWRVAWTHSTAATVEAVSIHGVTLEQACESRVRRIRRNAAASADINGACDSILPEDLVARLMAAADCGLVTTVASLLGELSGPFLIAATVPQLVAAASLVERIAAGHVPGLPRQAELAAEPDVGWLHVPATLLDLRPLLEAAIAGLEGLGGSNQAGDVTTVVELTALVRGERVDAEASLSSSLWIALRSRLARLRRDGSPRMQGAAWGALAMAGAIDLPRLQSPLASWYDGASHPEGRECLRERLAGLMSPLAPLVVQETEWLAGLQQCLKTSPDEEFLARLPALRAGFESMLPVDRVRLLASLLSAAGLQGANSSGAALTGGGRVHEDPELLAAILVADRAGRAAVARLLPNLMLPLVASRAAPNSQASLSGEQEQAAREMPAIIPLADRWRLVLGVKGCQSSTARVAASALDQLYGPGLLEGRGERADLATGGDEAPAPSPREWVEQVAGLFGKEVCEEVLGAALAGGRAALLEHLDPAAVRPSVTLLEQVLSLRGAVPERELAALRKLARKIVQRLVEKLAQRVRPALVGLSSSRPTRRASRRLDFARSIDANLHTARRREDGRVSLAPRQLVFRSPARREMDWHLVFVVDVSGSMDASVVYSAMLAAIFSALPAIDVTFLAFSTEVIDLSNSTDDALGLLLEVRVGGGTHIGQGLRAARHRVRNPSRTLVVLVTDFDEGISVGEMLAEVRQLAESGAKLIGLAALDDDAKPRYNKGNAAAVVAAGMPVAAVSPERLAEWVGDQIRGGSR
ncbi:MAG: DUF5682 family protein [Pirellulales bacterium]